MGIKSCMILHASGNQKCKPYALPFSIWEIEEKLFISLMISKITKFYITVTVVFFLIYLFGFECIF